MLYIIFLIDTPAYLNKAIQLYVESEIPHD